jgi:hypothetical protein
MKKEKNQAAVDLGRKGGNTTLKNKGWAHYKRISEMGVAKRREERDMIVSLEESPESSDLHQNPLQSPAQSAPEPSL